MYISATEGDEEGRRLGLARSASPLGPFVFDDTPLVDRWSIDGHPFRDDDGTMWLFYNVRAPDRDGVRGTGTICDRMLAPNQLEGNPTQVTFPSQAWEGPYGDWYWNEGPYVLKRRGVYYQMYSGGFHRDGTYAVGVAEARSPRGPWTKFPDNPVLRSSEHIVGVGHHSFVFGPDVATPYAVYHGYVDGQEGRKVCLDRLFWAGDRPHIAGPTEGEQPVPPRPVFDPDVPHWRAEAWVNGSWVETRGVRFPLDPPDVWHQVEVVQADDRFAVRIGGVLRASQPADGSRSFFDTDGELGPVTISSTLQDGGFHELPAESTYAWRWGGGDRLELALAVRGDVELRLDGAAHRLEGPRDRFRLVRLDHAGGCETIAVRAGAAGATVTDLVVYARR
jgi:hypothetical protein